MMKNILKPMPIFFVLATAVMIVVIIFGLNFQFDYNVISSGDSPLLLWQGAKRRIRKCK